MLDLEFEGVVNAEALCVKLRALRPSLPILPLGASREVPLLAELGCAPMVAKSLLVAEPSQLRVRLEDALRQEPQLSVPEGTFSYLLELADAALREERRRDQIEVLVLCRNVLLRCGLAHSLASLGIPAQLVAADKGFSPSGTEAPQGARLVFGPLADRVALQAVAQGSGLPLLLVALHEHEFEGISYADLGSASALLFDEAATSSSCSRHCERSPPANAFWPCRQD